MAAFPPSITSPPQLLPAGGALVPVTYAYEDIMGDVMADLMGISVLLTPAPPQLPSPSPWLRHRDGDAQGGSAAGPVLGIVPEFRPRVPL